MTLKWYFKIIKKRALGRAAGQKRRKILTRWNLLWQPRCLGADFICLKCRGRIFSWVFFFFVLFVFPGSRPVSSTLVSQFTGGRGGEDVLGREEPAWTQDGDGREKWEWNLPKQTLGLIKTSAGRRSGVRIPQRRPEEEGFPQDEDGKLEAFCAAVIGLSSFFFFCSPPLPFLFAVTWGDFPSAVNSLNFKSECKWRRGKVGGFEAAPDLNRPVVFFRLISSSKTPQRAPGIISGRWIPHTHTHTRVN